MSQHKIQYHQTVETLRDCYDTHADKFSSTRKKHRPEFERIADKLQVDDQIAKSSNRQLSIIELWCGDGRLYPYLERQWIEIKNYTGIDISKELIKKAKINNPNKKSIKRQVDDMIHALSTIASESTDVIICVASFQHLPNQKTREILLQHIYRVLRYGGQFITIDRSWSYWMIQKHRKSLINSLWQSLLHPWTHERNNLMIPFTSEKVSSSKWKANSKNQPITQNSQLTTHHRLYHIFTQNELKVLLKTQWFIIDEMIYSSQSGTFHSQRSQARNICTCVRKDIFVKPEKISSIDKNLHSHL